LNAGMVDDGDLAEAEGMGEFFLACHGAHAKGQVAIHGELEFEHGSSNGAEIFRVIQCTREGLGRDLNVVSHEGVEADPIAVGWAEDDVVGVGWVEVEADAGDAGEDGVFFVYVNR
jgi:hypothetical protein